MFTITPSHIIEYLYCPRYTFYEYILRIPQHQDKYLKVTKGREVHEQKARQNMEYLRRRLGVVSKHLNQYLTNDLLRGEVDEILLFEDGTMAPLDYKFAQYKDKVYETYRTQLFCYAWLIEENYGKSVNRGYLVYTRSKNKLVEIKITAKDKEQVKTTADEIKRLLAESRYPKATPYKKRCLNCTYRNICIQ